jgi:hypothetical protein
MLFNLICLNNLVTNFTYIPTYVNFTHIFVHFFGSGLFTRILLGSVLNRNELKCIIFSTTEIYFSLFYNSWRFIVRKKYVSIAEHFVLLDDTNFRFSCVRCGRF